MTRRLRVQKTQRDRIAALEHALFDERAHTGALLMIMGDVEKQVTTQRGNADILRQTIASNEKTIAAMRELAELHGAKVAEVPKTRLH
jgi:hypothetical protein